MPVILSVRDRRFLEALKRQRIMTFENIRLCFCDGSESAAKKLIQRLRDFIASDPLNTKSVVYRLTPAGAKLLGAPEEIARPLGNQALRKHLGILGLCLSGSEKRERLLRHEVIECFPEVADDLLGKDYHTDFFLDFDGTYVRLGQIVVDLGGDYRKLVSKCRVRLREYLDLPKVHDIVSDGLFTIAFVVAEEEKAAAIRAAVNEKPLLARTIVETSVELQKCPLLGGVTE